MSFNKIIFFLSFVIFSFPDIAAQTLTVDPVSGLDDKLITTAGFTSGVKRMKMDVNPATGYKVFVWAEDDGSGVGNRDIQCAVYDAQMVLINEFTVNTTTTGEQQHPIVSINKNDNSFIVAWTSYIHNNNVNDPNQNDIYAKKIRFSHINTDKLNADFLVNEYTAGSQFVPSVVHVPGYNEVIVGWVDMNGRDRLPTIVTGLDYGSYARRLSYSNSTLSYISGASDFQINSAGILSHQTLLDMKISPVTGELYAVMHYYNFPGGNGYDVVLRRLIRGGDGNYSGVAETMINDVYASNQTNPSIEINSLTGDYAVCWQDANNDCYCEIYNKNNVLVKGDFKVAPFVTNHNEIVPKIAWDEYSNYLLFFHWYSVNGTTSIRYTIFDHTYAKIKDEVHAISKNLNNYYGASYGLVYDQTMRRIFLVYDEYSSSNSALSQGWFRQLKYSGLPTTSTSNENYIEVQTFYKEIKDEALVDNLPVSSAYIKRTYFDGLGRTIQGVAVQASPLGNDEVQPIEYDQFGRQVKSYLPYTHVSQDGAFKSNYATSQAAFYNNNMNNNADRIVNDLYPYSERVTESTVANQLEEVSAPGNSWRLGSGHTLIKSLEFNVSNEIRLWTVNASNATSSGYYAADALFKTTSTDAMGRRIQTFTDKFGKVICIREFAAGCSTTACTKYTYKLYDIFGRLCYVVPPLAVEELITGGQSTWTVNYSPSSNIDKMSFVYKYDGRGRMIEKKSPDKAVEYIIYNTADRPVLVQDGNLRGANEWRFNKFDAMGRIIITGIYVDSRAYSVIQADIYSKPAFEKRDDASTFTGYTNVAYPVTQSNINTIDHYDDHNFDFDNNASTSHAYVSTGFSPEPIPAARNKRRHTCSRKRNLTTSEWLITVNYYDKRGRKIQERSNNHKNLSLQSSISYQFDFGGLLLNKKRVMNTTLDVITTTERYEYTTNRKFKNVFHKINNQPEILLTSMKMNELGQVVEKNLHSENGGSTYLQSLDFTFNIRGWLTHINNSTLTNSSLNSTPEDNNNDINDLFGMEMVFDKAMSGVTNMYNGSVAAIFWKSNNPSASSDERSYVYQYDGFDQLIDAQFGVKQAGVFQYGNAYRESNITYDKNGNIKTLNRYGSGGSIDNLTYNYASTGNQLNNVIDASGSTSGFNDRVNQAAELSYDSNGNLIADANKGITAISYNYLNLPVTIIFGSSANNNRIEITYDAHGTMLARKVIKAGTTASAFDYVESIYYENNLFKFFLTSEGRAVKSVSGSFTYQYCIKDHLGNTRIIFDKNLSGNVQIVQEDHYYAFGMRMLSYRLSNDGGTNNFSYNGKEHQDGIDINGDQVNDYDWDVYDFGARMYDYRLARWFNPDPADQFIHYTPYGYCMNNPMTYVDPDGEFIPLIIIAGAIIGAYIGGTVANGGELNPVNWEFDKPGTWIGMLVGGAVGALGGAVLATPGTSVAVGLATPAGTLGVVFSGTDGLKNLSFTNPDGNKTSYSITNSSQSSTILPQSSFFNTFGELNGEKISWTDYYERLNLLGDLSLEQIYNSFDFQTWSEQGNATVQKNWYYTGIDGVDIKTNPDKIFETEGTVAGMYKPIGIEVTNLSDIQNPYMNSTLSPAEYDYLRKIYPSTTESFNIRGGRNTYEIRVTFVHRPSF